MPYRWPPTECHVNISCAQGDDAPLVDEYLANIAVSCVCLERRVFGQIGTVKRCDTALEELRQKRHGLFAQEISSHT